MQAELGDEYRILNVAVSSGAPTEYGEVVAEMLSRDHPRVIHVCNCNAARFAAAPDGSGGAPAYVDNSLNSAIDLNNESAFYRLVYP